MTCLNFRMSITGISLDFAKKFKEASPSQREVLLGVLIDDICDGASGDSKVELSEPEIKDE